MKHLRWFVLGLLIAGVGVASAPLFRFVQFSDTHLHDAEWIAAQQAAGKPDGQRNYYTTPGKFRQAIAWAAGQEDVAFAVLTGDMIEKAVPVRYGVLSGIMDDFRKPWFAVGGNHDYGLRKLLPTDGSQGGDNRWFAWQGVLFVGLSTFNEPGMSHLVRRDTLAALAAFRQAHADAPMVALCHSPWVTREGTTDSWESPDNAAQLAAVVARAGGIEAVLCGHDHSWWSRTDGQTLHACVPGFCQAIAPLPPYTFVVWTVTVEGLAGQLMAVADDGRVVARDEHADYTWPAGRRPRGGAATWDVQPLPVPASDPLVAWFGADWVAAPGYELPPSWHEDAVLVPARDAKPVRRLILSRKDKPPADWFAVDFAADGWQDMTLPDRYWDHTKPREGHQQHVYRLTFDVDPAVLARVRLVAVKIMDYRSPTLYLNGQKLPAPTGMATADYWNGYAVVPGTALKPRGNVLAVGLGTSGWGGYQLDIEVAADLGGR